MKADPFGTPAEQARHGASWRTAAKGEGRCDGCQRSELAGDGKGPTPIHCPWLGCATKPNATCEFHSPISMPDPQETDPMTRDEVLEILRVEPIHGGVFLQVLKKAGENELRDALVGIDTDDLDSERAAMLQAKLDALLRLRGDIAESRRPAPPAAQVQPTPMTDAELAQIIETPDLPDPKAPNRWELLPEEGETSGELIVADSPEALSRAEAVQVAGMLQGMALVNKLLTVSTIKMLASMKESKKYKGAQLLVGGKLLTVSSWDDYCSGCGLSAKHVDENIRNLAALGEEFLEYSNQVGLGYRDLRKLRQLPADDRAVVLADVEIATGDKEAIVELIDGLAAKHAAQKAALEAKLGEAEANLEAARKVSGKRQERIDQLEEALEAKPTPTPDMIGLKAQRELAERTLKTVNSLNTEFLRDARAVLEAQTPRTAQAEAAVAMAAGQIIAAARDVCRMLHVLPAGDAAYARATGDDLAAVWEQTQAQLAESAGEA